MAWVEPVRLVGEHVILEPLQMAHAEALFDACRPEVFDLYVTLQPAEWTLDAFRAYLQKRMDGSNLVSFAIIQGQSLKPIGETAFMDIRPEAKGLEIGLTWIAEAWRGTAINPEIKFLMLRHAFEVLHAERVQLKTDARNLHSQAAIKKLGAQYEGTLRRHGIQPNGYVRDTVMFSIIAEEWPAVSARLKERLARHSDRQPG